MLLANVPFSDLAAFEAGGSKPGKCETGEGLYFSDRDASLVYHGPGFVGGQWREIQCRYHHAGYHLSVNGIGEFMVGGKGEVIYQEGEEPGVSLQHVIETILGPVLVLALASAEVWCLHASAVSLVNRTIAFLGESGMGKSTLAAWLDREGTGGAVRVTDDILPVRASASSLEALPHFPQLKLPTEKQPALTMPERMRLDAVYILRRPAAGGRVEVRQLDGQSAALALVRHTAASRLFAPDLLVKHLDFCLGAVGSVPVGELVYPLTPAALPLVRDVLVQSLPAQPDTGGVPG